MHQFKSAALVILGVALSAPAFAIPINNVPEPGTLALLGAGIAALVVTQIRKKK